jgi:hypothetical protein
LLETGLMDGGIWEHGTATTRLLRLPTVHKKRYGVMGDWVMGEWGYA